MEELKLILETIKTISGDASTVAIWWVVLHYGVGILKVLATAGAVVGVVYLVVRGFISTSDWANAGKSVSRAYGGSEATFGFYEKDAAAIAKAISAASKP